MNVILEKFDICARAPLRLGIAGGGTDVSPYCDIYGGCVLNATLRRYAFCTLKRNDQNQVSFCSGDLNAKECFDLDEPITPGGKLDLLKAVYREFCQKYFDGKNFPITIYTFCDCPIGSGLGASSTLVVSIIKAFGKLFNTDTDDYQIAQLAFKIEREICGHQGGRQDQYSATFGGFNFMQFFAEEKAVITPIRLKDEIKNQLESSILLYYSGLSRRSADIIKDQSINVSNNNQSSIDAMHGIKIEAEKVKDSLLTGNFQDFLQCLRNGWEHKKKSSQIVSNPIIESIYTTAIEAGALGGKVSGAGGGGFMMFYVPLEKRPEVISALRAFNGHYSNCSFEEFGACSWHSKSGE
jgi:D-glycero-alpha-D-manno-heptose-7-phosphate kinase